MGLVTSTADLPAVPQAAPSIARRRGGTPLPADIAFLRRFHIDELALQAAAASSLRCGADASAVLIAEGGATDTLYYRSLARHLGLGFTLDWPQVDDGATPSLRRARLPHGRVRLAGGGWLLAPTGRALHLLLAARRKGVSPGLFLGSGWSITTPAHLTELLVRRLPGPIADRAGAGLAEAAPLLSARGALHGASGRALTLAATLGLAGLVGGSRIAIDALCLMFFAALCFRLMVSAAGWSPMRAARGASTGGQPVRRGLGDAELPVYSALVPLRDEAAMVPALVRSMKALDYPRAKLDVLFLVEADDAATRLALLAASLPPFMRVIVVPDGRPRTKPRALNAGLMLARGDLVTVYDAEDRPAPDQLRRAAARFAAAGPGLACVQAHLAVSNGGDGLLQRLFAIEYAGLFDNLQIGAARLGLPLALGGTSNHFRTALLRRVGGWDGFNVTEDADLGLRFARFGYGVDDLRSDTAERAEASLLCWFNQRRRWTKGWMQTALVLSRGGARRDLGYRRAAAVALMMVNLVGGPLFAPVALPLLALHLVRVGLPAPGNALELCEATLAASVFLLGLVAPPWCGYAGCRARGLKAGPALLAMIPYQMMIAAAAWGGFVDLVRRPYHWRKTPHTPGTGPAAPVRPSRGRALFGSPSFGRSSLNRSSP